MLSVRNSPRTLKTRMPRQERVYLINQHLPTTFHHGALGDPSRQEVEAPTRGSLQRFCQDYFLVQARYDALLGRDHRDRAHHASSSSLSSTSASASANNVPGYWRFMKANMKALGWTLDKGHSGKPKWICSEARDVHIRLRWYSQATIIIDTF